MKQVNRSRKYLTRKKGILCGTKHTVRLLGGPLVYVCQDEPVKTDDGYMYTVKLVEDKCK